MNCQDMQNQILLAHSGELPDADAAKLETHISGCAACRTYRAELTQMLALAGEALPVGNPSPTVMQAILQEAHAANARRRQWLIMLRGSLALASAAALLILVGGLFLAPRPEAPDGEHAVGRIDEVNAILAMVGEKQLPAQAPADAASASAHSAAIRDLAMELLRMEGLMVDDLTTSGSATPPGEPAPTTLRSRSTLEYLPEICG